MNPYNVNMITRVIIASIVALYLAFSGHKKKSLSISGAVAALIVGFVSFSTSYRFGILLILFYYTGSKFTKLKEDVKASLEDGYLVGGQRNVIQVLANSILATFVAIIYFYMIGEDTNVSFKSNDSNMITFFGYTSSKSYFNGILWCAYIAHYACAAGDTWASEIGILSTTPPRLVTKLLLVKVPPGTNGGMSLLGTFASAAGGASIGLGFYLFSFLITNNESSSSSSTTSTTSFPPSQYPMIAIGFICGLIGSLFDSLLGGTLQASYYSKDRKKIVKVNDTTQDPSIVLICGMNILSNDAVNFLSIFGTMLFAIFIGPRVFCALDSAHC
eukprot:gene3793-7537_t